MTLTNESAVYRNGNVVEAHLAGEIALLNPDTGDCYGLNPTASHVWKLMVNPISVGQICHLLQSEYNVDPGTCQAQVLELLQELKDGDLISLSETLG